MGLKHIFTPLARGMIDILTRGKVIYMNLEIVKIKVLFEEFALSTSLWA